MKAKKCAVPTTTLLKEYLAENYSDCYTVKFTHPVSITPNEILKGFWTDMPAWINWLFHLRNILVKPFGLEKGTDKESFIENMERCIEEEENNGKISVPFKSDDETVLCLEDKHLTAFLSVHMEKKENNQQKASLITVVKFHYWFGYIYFYTILPFHHFVVKAALKNAIKKTIKKNNQNSLHLLNAN